MTLIRIDLPHIVSFNATNGKHWSGNVRRKKDFYNSVLFTVLRNSTPELDGQYDFTYSFLVKSRLYDATNYFLMVKMLEDGLVKCGVLKDDSKKYVNSIRVIAKKDKCQERLGECIISIEKT